MSDFADNAMTTAGSALVAKAMTGQQILFTRIVLGDGYMPSAQTPENMTDVVAPRVEVPITKCELNHEGGAVVGGRWDNSTQTEGFYWRELGLYAQDPDNGEILYSYGNSAGVAEWIPAGNNAAVIEKLIDVVTYVGYAANVTAVFDKTANVKIDNITDPEIDELWGSTGVVTPPGGETGTGDVVVGMTNREVEGLFGGEGA